jgi:hypothetical protein
LYGKLTKCTRIANAYFRSAVSLSQKQTAALPVPNNMEPLNQAKDKVFMRSTCGAEIRAIFDHIFGGAMLA